MLYIFDPNENLIALLKPDFTRSTGPTTTSRAFLSAEFPAEFDREPAEGCPYWGASHYEKLNGENTLKFVVPADQADAAYVQEGNLVAFKDLDAYWQFFEIKRMIDAHADGLTRTAYCEHIFYELLDDIVTDKRPSADATSALSGMLEGTRWQTGVVDNLGASSTNAYYESALSGVQKVAIAWKGELQWRCVITGGVVTRYCDLLAMRGTDTGKQFVYSKDIISIEREVDTSGVVTALYGRGKGVETDAGTGYGRRLTFADVVWTVAGGDPVDKPLGQEWVGDPGALAQFGRPGGRHRFGVFTNEDETNPTLLLQETWDDLQTRKTPRLTYRLKVAALETLTGYSHEAVRLGDLVRVIDREFKPELVVSARVVELNRDLQSPESTEAVLGSFAPTIVEVNIGVERRVNDLANKPYNTKWLDGVIDVLQNEINNTQSYVFQTPGDGILIMDAATFALATKAMKIGGGIFALANTKTGDQWNWRAFGDGAGFTADEINAGLVKAQFVQIGSASAFATGYDPSGKLSAGMGVDSDCTALFHFDGSLNSHKGLTPAFTRASVAYYLSDGTQVAADVPRFEAGKFGKGVLIEGSMTNLLTANQSSVETDLTGFSAASCTLTRDTGTKRAGTASAKCVCTGNNQGFNLALPTLSANFAYVLSAWVLAPAGQSMLMYASDNVDKWIASAYFTGTGIWQYVTAVGSTDAHVTGCSMSVMTATAANVTFYADCMQIEQKGYATSWQIGGTARNAEVLTVPTAGVFTKGNWTIGMVFKPINNVTGQHVLWQYRIDANNSAILFIYAGALYLQVFSAGTVYQITGATVAVGGVYTIVTSGDGAHIRMCMNGVQVGPDTVYVEPVGVLPATMSVGCSSDVAGLESDCIIDELRIDKIAHTAEEVASWYKANSPFYSSEDVAQLPGYLRAETDGYKVYDSAGALRVLLGSWLRDAIRKYGAKIIDGEIYSSLFRTGVEGATAYLSLEAPNSFTAYFNSLKTFELLADFYYGRLHFYDEGDLALEIGGRTEEALIDAVGDLKLSADANITIAPGVSGKITVGKFTGNIIPYTDDTGTVGGTANRWSLIRGKIITPGDLGWEERSCILCDQAFKAGDVLILWVRHIHEDYGTLTIPIHDGCKGIKKALTFEVPEIEIQYHLNPDTGDIEEIRTSKVKTMQKTVKELKKRFNFDAKTGLFNKDAVYAKVLKPGLEEIINEEGKTRVFDTLTGKEVAKSLAYDDVLVEAARPATKAESLKSTVVNIEKLVYKTITIAAEPII